LADAPVHSFVAPAVGAYERCLPFLEPRYFTVAADDRRSGAFWRRAEPQAGAHQGDNRAPLVFQVRPSTTANRAHYEPDKLTGGGSCIAVLKKIREWRSGAHWGRTAPGVWTATEPLTGAAAS